ncbi:MAG TPA: hypothetical protein VMU11_04600 [Verrucomicrobiae bacterium]|nr:hypothetical protein [Verrucomicrobiae bacterium]
MSKKATPAQIAEIVSMLAKGDYDRDFAQALIGKRVMITPHTVAPITKYTAIVEYRQPTYVELCKRFDWVEVAYNSATFERKDVCKDVPSETREVEFELVRFYEESSEGCDPMHLDEIIIELGDRGLRPALYEELLAFGAQYPELQKQFRICAPGSWLDNGRDDYKSPVLSSGEGDSRGLDYTWLDEFEDYSIHFLAVRK